MKERGSRPVERGEWWYLEIEAKERRKEGGGKVGRWEGRGK